MSKSNLEGVKAGSYMSVLYRDMGGRVSIATLISFPRTLPSLELSANLQGYYMR